MSAGVQQRIGPEYAGPFGIIQSLADGIKLLLKEDIVPARGDTWLFNIGPAVVVTPVFISHLVIPFGQHIILSDPSIGVSFWIAISSIVPLGLLMAGYGSNNKYSFLGGLRAAAQSISYEIPLALCILSISLRAIRRVSVGGRYFEKKSSLIDKLNSHLGEIEQRFAVIESSPSLHVRV